MYKKKIAGSWQNVGSGSEIKNRSFRDNPFAGQGSRNSIVLLEECFSPETQVRLYNGTVKEIKDLKIDDALMSPDNKPTYVKHI
jgi:hypothetical protein